MQTSERTTVDVLAAGTEGRNFPLPGGGQVQLQPGTTVEVERAGATLTLKLLHGVASVDTADAQRVAGLMIVAGEAQLNTQAGSVINVRRNRDDIDVEVSDGSVSITSPDRAVPQKLGRNGRLEGIPIHAATAALSPTSSPAVRAPLLVAGSHRQAQPRLGKLVTVVGPAWLTSYENNEDSAALALLRQQPGGLGRDHQRSQRAGADGDQHDRPRKGGRSGRGDRRVEERRRPLPGGPRTPRSRPSRSRTCTSASGKTDLAAAYLERANKLTGPSPRRGSAAGSRASARRSQG